MLSIKFIIKRILATVLPQNYYEAIFSKYHRFRQNCQCSRIRSRWKKNYSNFFAIIGSMELPREAQASCFFSQRGQDWFLATYCFPGRQEGFFLDIGANHPKVLSNTLYFENIGWRGLAFEPQIRLQRLWAEQRTTPCIPCALGECETIITFNQVISDDWEHALSFVEGVSDKVPQKLSVKKISIPQKKLSDILSKKNITDIDFISLDVEGYELNVLKGIDFSKVNIKYFIIENDCTLEGDNTIRDFLKQYRYIHIANIYGDDIFCHEDTLPHYEKNLKNEKKNMRV